MIFIISARTNNFLNARRKRFKGIHVFNVGSFCNLLLRESFEKMKSKVFTNLLFITCSETSTTNKLRLHSHTRIFTFVTWPSKSNLTRDSTFSSYVCFFCWSVYNSLFSWKCYHIMFISIFIRKFCIWLGSANMSYSNSNMSIFKTIS